MTDLVGVPGRRLVAILLALGGLLLIW
jgi:hypothetical protein